MNSCCSRVMDREVNRSGKGAMRAEESYSDARQQSPGAEARDV